jgi:ribose transport system substrate-binding protein
MKKSEFVISLPTNDNDFQRLQESSVQNAARRLGVQVRVIHADNDSVTQSQQLLELIQGREDSRPAGIVFEPAGGTALPQVAQAAAAAGIAWGVMNCEADYLSKLRSAFRIPVFAVTANHTEVGRIQGQQLAVLLPNGGTVLYIEGPSQSMAAKQRTAGMNSTKPSNISLKQLKGHWTEESSYRAVQAWLRLSTSRQSLCDGVAAQDDSMASGARKALLESADPEARQRWEKVFYLGCDGVPETGQTWVNRGLLAGTVVIPAIAGQALEMMVNALQTGKLPPERTLTDPYSYPALDALAKRAKSQSAGKR